MKSVSLHICGGVVGMGCSSYSFMTSALDEVSGQRHVPVALNPRFPLDRRLGGPQELVCTQRLEENTLSPRWGSNLDRPVRSQTLY
jgi:hypothetical protein